MAFDIRETSVSENAEHAKKEKAESVPEIAAQSAADKMRLCTETQVYPPGSGNPHNPFDRVTFLEQGDTLVAEHTTRNNGAQSYFFNLDSNNKNPGSSDFGYEKEKWGNLNKLEPRNTLSMLVHGEAEKTTKLPPGSPEYDKATERLASLNFDAPSCENGLLVQSYMKMQEENKNELGIRLLNKIFGERR